MLLERGALRGLLPGQESKMNLQELDNQLKERAEKVEVLQALARIEAALNELVEIARGQDQLLNYARQQEDMVQAIRDAALEIEREKAETPGGVD